MTTGRLPVERQGWWRSPWLWLILCLTGALPLLWPTVPPLTDAPGHIGRYAIQTGLAEAPDLQRWYDFHWTLIPNLGVDLLVQGLAPLLGLEPAVKLIVAAIPVIQMAGFVLVARQAHGHVPPTVAFALPLTWGYPLHFGFLNFALSVACATLAFALWMRLARAPALRIALFVPVACVLWVMHIYGWAILGVLVLSDELARRRGEGAGWAGALLGAIPVCLPLATPQILKMLLPLPTTGVGATVGFFTMAKKLGWFVMAFRDRWIVWDLASLFLLVGLIIWGWRSRRFDRHPGLSMAAVMIGIIYLALPTKMIGSYYADMRLVPMMLAVPLLALRPSAAMTPSTARRIAWAAVLFFAARILSNTASLYLYDRDYARELGALDHIPHGATLATLVYSPCTVDQTWQWGRLIHLGGIALARRHSFSNDQWYVPGGQLLSVHFPQAGSFDRDPSQRATPRQCDTDATALDRSLATIPPVFDHLWVVAPPRPLSLPGWHLRWRNGSSALYARAGAGFAKPQTHK